MITTISKTQLKQTIDLLDSRYLELAYKILQQFPQQIENAQIPEETPLKGSVLRYVVPTEPVADHDWDILQ